MSIDASAAQDFFDQAPCGLIAADEHGRIVRINAAVAELVGKTSHEVAGQHIAMLLTVGSRLYYETHLAPLLHLNGSVSEVALDLAGCGGARIPILVNAREDRDSAGRLAGISYALFVTEGRRQYERRLLAAKTSAEGAVREVRESAELREELMAVLGHDLRNPLAAVTSGLGLLKRENPNARAQRVIALIEASMVRASVLIDNVLDFARGRLGGGIDLKRDDSKPISAVVEQVLAEMRLIAPERAIVAHIDVPRPVSIDPGRMGQLVSNLLGNALTHGDDREPVRLHVGLVGEDLELSVANGGAPIPKEIMANLFRPFVRGEGKGNLRGLGLGLYIASEIARAHGGNLDVASSADETRFTFRMPIAT